MRRLAGLLAISALLAALPAAPMHAQAVCPEGRTFSGACVNAGLAQSMRKQAIVYSLPKFSYTAPPMLPREDGEYYVPRDYHELRTLFGVESAVPCVNTPIHPTGC